jgi:hypothetical protein
MSDTAQTIEAERGATARSTDEPIMSVPSATVRSTTDTSSPGGETNTWVP